VVAVAAAHHKAVNPAVAEVPAAEGQVAQAQVVQHQAVKLIQVAAVEVIVTLTMDLIQVAVDLV
jgi:hypothetical protein